MIIQLNLVLTMEQIVPPKEQFKKAIF